MIRVQLLNVLIRVYNLIVTFANVINYEIQYRCYAAWLK